MDKHWVVYLFVSSAGIESAATSRLGQYPDHIIAQFRGGGTDFHVILDRDEWFIFATDEAVYIVQKEE